MKKILLLTLLLSISFTAQVFAKNNLDLSDTSVILLKSFNDEGKTIRSQDVPIEKVDVSEDTSRVKILKEKFFRECARDNLKPRKPIEEHSETLDTTEANEKAKTIQSTEMPEKTENNNK